MNPTIRDARESDMSYVRACWSRTAYDALKIACFWSRQARAPLYTLFGPLFELVQARLLRTASVLVAVNPDDDDQVFGCIVFVPSADGPPVLHFVAVKRDFQKRGIAHSLFVEAGIRADEPTIYSLGAMPRMVRGEHRSNATFAAPKTWTYVPYGLMP